MLELGYELDKFNKNNIILISNEKIIKIIPSMINDFKILYYNTELIDYESVIVDKIIYTRIVNN